MDIVRKGRLDKSPEEVAHFLSSMREDEWIFEADIAVGRAHVVMLAEQGILEESDAGLILDAINEVGSNGFGSLPDAEDVHPAIEQAVIDRVGEELGGQLHTARSRNDEVSSCIRIRLREEILGLVEEVLGLREALLERGLEMDDWLMPGYTHLQRAQPTTMGHHLLSYAFAFERDTQRLLQAYERVNRCPLGSVAFAGTGFDIDRERTSELLGFYAPTRNSMDGVAARDFMVESVAVAANLLTSLSRMCEDLVVWSSSEFGYIEFSDAYSSTSSVMPQKKNPDTAELARGKTASVVGSLVALYTNLKGQPMAYNRDLQEATPHLWRSYSSARDSVRVLRGVIEEAEFDREAMERGVEQGFTGATALADSLVRNGVPFRTAHHIVAELAANYEVEEINSGVIMEVAEEFGVEVGITDEEVDEALDPVKNIESHDSFGGPGEVSDAVDDAYERLEDDLEKVTGLDNDLDAAEKELNKAVEDLIND